MPIYEYECTRCLSRFDVKRSFGENGGASCPTCEGEARRVFSPVPIFFKGPGFYATDGAKKGPTCTSSAAKEGKAAECCKDSSTCRECKEESSA